MKWLKFSPLDSRGRESRTLGFVRLALYVLLVKFAFADWAYVAAALSIKFAPMTATEFGAAFALIVGIWLGREWSEKRKTDGAAP
jgi:hypothetical protein